MPRMCKPAWYLSGDNTDSDVDVTDEQSDDNSETYESDKETEIVTDDFLFEIVDLVLHIHNCNLVITKSS